MAWISPERFRTPVPRDAPAGRGRAAPRSAEPPRVGLLAPLPPQVGGVASFAGWLLEREAELGCRLEAFDLWRPGGAGGRLTPGAAAVQVRLVSRFLRWLPRAPRLVHACVSYTSTGLVRDLLLVTLLRLSGRRVIAHVHGGLVLQPRHGWKAAALRGIARLSVAVVAPAPRAAASIEALGVEARTVPNPVRLAAVAAVRQPASPPRLLFVGRLARAKGVHELVAAVGRLVRDGIDVAVDLVGEEEAPGERAEVETAVAQSDAPGVYTLHGAISADRLADLYAAASVFVLPSHVEALPMALLEAMASGVAVVATGVGAVPDVVADGATGLIVPVDDAEALADALRRVLGDDELRDRLGAAAASRARSFADPDSIVDAWRSLYAGHLAEAATCA